MFFFKGMNRALLDGMLGFTGGVMVAASFWSLLAPGIEMSEGEGFVKVIPAVVGFACCVVVAVVELGLGLACVHSFVEPLPLQYGHGCELALPDPVDSELDQWCHQISWRWC